MRPRVDVVGIALQRGAVAGFGQVEFALLEINVAELKVVVGVVEVVDFSLEFVDAPAVVSAGNSGAGSAGVGAAANVAGVTGDVYGQLSTITDPGNAAGAISTALITEADLTTTGLLTSQLEPGLDQWCQNCDGLWRPWSMGWTELGLWWCFRCRHGEEIDKRFGG